MDIWTCCFSQSLLLERRLHDIVGLLNTVVCFLLTCRGWTPQTRPNNFGHDSQGIAWYFLQGFGKEHTLICVNWESHSFMQHFRNREDRLGNDLHIKEVVITNYSIIVRHVYAQLGKAANCHEAMIYCTILFQGDYPQDLLGFAYNTCLKVFLTYGTWCSEVRNYRWGAQ